MTDIATETAALAPVANNRLMEASRIISSSVRWSVATAAIPLPIIDLMALAAVQANMVNDLSHLYGQTFAKQAVQSVVSILLGTLIPGGVANAVGSSAKFMPGVGTLFGVVVQAGAGSAATYAIGKVLVKYFEGGGTVESFSPEAVASDLKKEFVAASSKSKPVSATA